MSKLFMKSKPLPPTEYTEEQTSYNSYGGLFPSPNLRGGQRLTIAGREVTHLGFWLSKEGSPTGDVVFEIRKVSDDGLLASKVALDASALTGDMTYYEVEFDTPPTINEEVRTLAYHAEGDFSHNVHYAIQTTDVKGGEYRTMGGLGAWNAYLTNDTAYRYKYYEV